MDFNFFCTIMAYLYSIFPFYFLLIYPSNFNLIFPQFFRASSTSSSAFGAEEPEEDEEEDQMPLPPPPPPPPPPPAAKISAISSEQSTAQTAMSPPKEKAPPPPPPSAQNAQAKTTYVTPLWGRNERLVSYLHGYGGQIGSKEGEGKENGQIGGGGGMRRASAGDGLLTNGQKKWATTKTVGNSGIVDLNQIGLLKFI
jgi:hypothetical protein